jgi:hypothetical protein
MTLLHQARSASKLYAGGRSGPRVLVRVSQVDDAPGARSFARRQRKDYRLTAKSRQVRPPSKRVLRAISRH